MKQIDVTEFQGHFGRFIDLVRDGPITVLRDGQPVGVFLSVEEYEHSRRLDDAFWVARAEAAVSRGEFLWADEVTLDVLPAKGSDR